MKPFYLVETVTQDKLIHQGIFFAPKEKSRRAILWVHGLTSAFYHNQPLIHAITSECDKNNFGFAAFNNRGHDIITGLKKEDKRKPKGYTRINGGAGVENFKDSIFDIQAGIDFLVKQGFKEIIVIGHSTGANKVCYFAGSKKNLPNVSGVILASPVSDRLDPAVNKIKLAQDLIQMQELVNQEKGDELLTGVHFFPTTPKRFLSSFSPNSLEDQFDYGDPRPRMKYFSKIKKPLLVLVGSKDEYLDRPVKKFMEVFDTYQHSTNYESAIIPHATHGYTDQENQVAQIIVSWVKSI